AAAIRASRRRRTHVVATLTATAPRTPPMRPPTSQPATAPPTGHHGQSGPGTVGDRRPVVSDGSWEPMRRTTTDRRALATAALAAIHAVTLITQAEISDQLTPRTGPARPTRHGWRALPRPQGWPPWRRTRRPRRP